MKRILLLSLFVLPVLSFAADEYAGAQLPIVFAGPRSFIHNDKEDAHELVDGRFHDVDQYVAKLDWGRLYPIYDAGQPKLVTSILVQGAGKDTDNYNTGRVGSFRVYGSNDMSEWTLFWEGHAHAISRDWILRLVRDPATGASTGYRCARAATPVLSTATVEGTWDDSAYPCSTRYRYYRVGSVLPHKHLQQLLILWIGLQRLFHRT